jgi:serine/threonine protein kinase/tetratricopeptide (TPR) repeat protein
MSDAELQVDSSVESLVGRVADEFLRRQRDGERPDVEEYIAHYPQAAELLRTVLASLRLLDCSRGGADVPPTAGPAPTAVAAEEVEGTLGDFRIRREVGRGGMGVVYEAVQISLGRPVALKVLPFAAALDARQLQRFKNEAQAAACLHHTNIVPVFAVGCERGVHFYAMQLIDGQTLAAVIHDLRQREDGVVPADPQRTVAWTPRSPAGAAQTGDTNTPLAQALSTERPTRSPAFCRTAARLGVQAAHALEHAHALGIIHRDVKPGNLMIDGRGNLWVTDFGLAHIQGDAKLTMTGDLLGTLRYMSPEQALAQRVVVDHRTDVYSLGATLYELLTLKPAFGGRDRGELLRQIAFEEPCPARRINKAIPAELETIVHKAMAKNPSERYATAQDFADDLERFLKDEPIRARRPTLVQRSRKWGRRHKAVMASLASVAAMLVLAVVLGAIWYAVQARRLADARVSTNEEISAALSEAVLLEAQDAGRAEPEAWARVREMARRAETLAESSLADPALVARVRELRARLDEEEQDRQVLNSVEQARLARTTLKDDHRDFKAADEAYAAAFRKYGIDVEALAPPDAAARIRARRIGTDLAAALDDWAQCKPAGPGLQRLRAIAREADPDVRRKRVRDAVVSNDLPALKALCASADVESWPAPTLQLLADSLASLGDMNPAARLLLRAQRRYPGDFWINHQLGLYLSNKEPAEPRRALRFLNVALTLRPQAVWVRCHLGAALVESGQWEEAITELHETIRRKKDYAYAHYNLGNALAGMGQFDAAVAAYREAIRLKSDYAPAHCNLGVALARKGQLDAAIAAYQEAIRLNKEYALAHSNLGSAWMRKGQMDAAITAYREAIRLKKDYAEAHNDLATALIEKRQFDMAIRECKEAIRIKKDYDKAHYNLGGAYLRKRQLDAAIAAYREAIRLNKDYARAHFALGIALAQKGEFDASIAAYRDTIHVQKDHAHAHWNLGHMLRRQGYFRLALAELRRAHELGVKEPRWRFPSARWVRDVERLVELDDRLPALLEGKATPASAAERVELAHMCSLKRLYGTAVRFFEQAFSAQPELATGRLTSHRFDAACASVLAAADLGESAARSGDAERTRLRSQARGWLRDELTAWTKRLEAGGKEPGRALGTALALWRSVPALAWVRDPDQLARLPAGERQAWQALWEEVDKTLQRARTAPSGNTKLKEPGDR